MWFGKTVKKLDAFDIQLMKASMFFLGLFIASYIPVDILVKYRWIWLAVTIALAIKPIIIMLKHMKI